MTDQEMYGELTPGSPKRAKGSIILGICFSLVAPAMFWLGMQMRMPVGDFFAGCLLVIGVSQLMIVVPLLIFSKIQKATRTIQGLLIGAGVVFLINAACFGLVMTSFK